MGCSASVAELPNWARALLDDARVARLGLTDEEGGPRVLPVTFAIAGDGLVSAVDDKPKRLPGEQLARVRWLRARPRSAITVDRYDDDWSKLAWVQAIGEIQILDPSDAPQAITALQSRYAPYRDNPPQGPLLALTPHRLLWWRASE